MRIDRSEHAKCIILTLTGHLDRHSGPAVHQALLRALVQRPAAVICDLTGVARLDPAGASAFAAATHPASGWPANRLLLCGASPAVAAILAQRAITTLLPVYNTLEQALRHALRPPARARAFLRLATPQPQAQAGRFVRQQCADWNTVGLGERARLLAEALVTHALATHTHHQQPHEQPHEQPCQQLDMLLRMELRPGHLGISVHDRHPRRLHAAPTRDRDQIAGDQGELAGQPATVQRLAAVWGIRPDPGGGKIVWGELAHW
jgi:anti-anti-sigma factor